MVDPRDRDWISESVSVCPLSDAFQNYRSIANQATSQYRLYLVHLQDQKHAQIVGKFVTATDNGLTAKWCESTSIISDKEGSVEIADPIWTMIAPSKTSTYSYMTVDV